MKGWGILQVREKDDNLKDFTNGLMLATLLCLSNSTFHSLWVVMNVNVADWFGQRVLTGYVVITTVYRVSAWSPGI